MPLQSSGPISLNDIHVELGATSGTTVSLNDADVRALGGFNSTEAVPVAEFYGISAYTSPITTTSAIADLSGLIQRSSAIKIDDGVTSTLYTDYYTSTPVTSNITRTANFTSKAGRDVVITFIYKDLDSGSTDIISFGAGSTGNWSWNPSRNVFTDISGNAMSTASERTTVLNVSGAASSTYAIVDNISGDSNDIYQVSMKFLNLASNQGSSAQDVLIRHDDDEDGTGMILRWYLNFSIPA